MPMSTAPAAVFPLYLLKSNPFRRRSTPTPNVAVSSSANEDPLTSSSLPTPSYLSGSLSILRCNRCLAHICPTKSIISKGFNGRWGRAYLVAPPKHAYGTLTPTDELDLSPPRHHQAGNLPNIHVHKPQPRNLVTGAHTVSDISCIKCGSMLGWKYVDAEEEGQKYKVGNFILEMKRVMVAVDWENDDVEMDNTPVILREKKVEHERKDSAVSFGSDASYDRGAREAAEFDSEDEDECEDLFMGMWTPALAKKRRKAKAWRDETEIV